MIITLNQIKSVLPQIDVISAMKKGFIEYSNGNSVVPPVGELIFNDPPGDVHIKYGYIKGQEHYTIKIASGFYENHKLGLPSGQGMMLLFQQKSGKLEAILLDEGHLTDVRTAAAGALCAQVFSPSHVEGIGIIGTGVQARMQLEYIQQNMPCQNVWIWGRSKNKADKMRAELADNYDIKVAVTPEEVAQNCNVIVTTTPSDEALLNPTDIRPSTLIIAMGSDTQHKQELHSEILKKADVVISDSIPQSGSRGEIYQAIKAGAISKDKVTELGSALQNSQLGRTHSNQIIVTDLTGVAVQDIMISSAVFQTINSQG